METTRRTRATLAPVVATLAVACLGALLPLRMARAFAMPAAGGDQIWEKTYGTSDVSYDLVLAPDGSTVYVTGDDDASIVTAAYDAQTGARLWLTTKSAGTEADAGQIQVSPDGSNLYVGGTVYHQDGSREGLVVAYGTDTGAEEWSSTYDNPDSPFDSGSGVAVTADGGSVALAAISVVGSGRNVLDLTLYDAATGAQTWTSTYGQKGYNRLATSVASASGGILVVTGQEQVIGQRQASILTLGYSVGSGSLLWSARYAGKTNNNIGQQVVVAPDGSAAYVTGVKSAKRSNVMTTLAYDTATGAQRWATVDPVGAKERSEGTRLAVLGDGSRVAAIGEAHVGSKPWHARTIVYDATTGGILWRGDYRVKGDSAGFGDDVAGSPDGGSVYALAGRCPLVNCDGGGRVWTVVAYGSVDGSTEWTATHVPPQGGDLRAFAAGANATEVFVTGDQFDGQDDSLLTVALSTV